MSYRGRPSKGCESCRARKVKCDEKKPTCSRCVKSNFDCKYRDQGDLLFRNQTASAAQRAEESWRKRSKSNQRAVSESSASNPSPPSNASPPPSDESSPSVIYQWTAGGQQGYQTSPHGSTEEHSHKATDAVVLMPDLARMHLTPDVEPDLHRLAFARLFHDFIDLDSPIKPSEEPVAAVWSFIPIIYQAAAEGSCFRTVVDAVAYVNYANRCNVPQAMVLAEDCMARGINLISKMVADKKLAASDETLGSVYLLAVYENMTTVQRKGTFIAHQHGANALLQLRTIEQFYSNPVSASLYDVAYCQMLLANIQSAIRPPMKDLAEDANRLPRLYGDYNAYVISLISQEANVHAQWHDIKRSHTLPATRLDLQKLLQSALDLDIAFQAWEADVPPKWSFEAKLLTPEARSKLDVKFQQLLFDSTGAPQEIHAYPNLKQSWVWGFFRTAWLFLMRDILEMINWMLRLPIRLPNAPYHDATNGADTAGHLDDMTLQIQYSLATISLVRLFEQSCAAMCSIFTIPITKRENGDTCGMRGYLCLWPLGYMDAILSAGLIPDSQAYFDTPNAHLTPQGLPYRHNRSHVPTIVAIPPEETSPIVPDAYATAPQFSELSKLPPKIPTERSPSPHPSSPQSSNNQAQSSPAANKANIKGHIFDSSPAHPYDQPINQLQLDPAHSIDVAARREWLNTILYYIASDLGIKKAFYVPATEGFLQKVKPKVDFILGR